MNNFIENNADLLLDLRVPDEREEFIERNSESAGLTCEDVERYVTTAEELDLPAFWFLVTPTAGIPIPVEESHTHSIRPEEAVWVLDELASFRSEDGFRSMLNGFRNPPQVMDSVAEIRCARILKECERTRAVQPGQRIENDGRASRPDLRWKTDVGELNVEVKSMTFHETQRMESFRRLSSDVQSVFDEWSGELERTRIDVMVSQLGGGVRNDVRQAREELRLDLATDTPGASHGTDAAEVCLSDRSDPAPGEDPLLRIQTLLATDESRELALENAWLTTGMEIGGFLRREARKLMKRARSQLEAGTKPGVICLEAMKSGPVAAYAEDMLSDESYRQIPLVLVINQQVARYVYRTSGDVEDDRLSSVLPALSSAPRTE